MKKTLGFMAAFIFLHGCTTVPESKTNTDRLATAGLLLCKPNEQCPVMAASWNSENKNQLRIDVRLNSSYLYYDIKKVTFIVDGKHLSYIPAQPTELQYISRLEPKRSSNHVVVPTSFLNDFKNAKRIDVQINTDHGAIKRPMYIDGQASSAYQNFVNVYSS
ncbi:MULTISPECIES: hypothetical protein [unclassified Acinetobacter]|uniref:hypothetical protein n=1 Tax=unclassified Acinetobacter TaxID=196816 RepID=UPI00190C70AC|nr:MULTISPECIES: hypothetical protein [unclassified Acinetobacter]MBK0062926.1 hypothetical protein [Acinetobacter sp. S55]MBK0066656.1 hypothetical protein [Acinetobacter sp. S54]